MKTLFFSALEVTEENKNTHDATHKNDNICFNTENILTPHDVLSAIKVSLIIIIQPESGFNSYSFYVISDKTYLISYRNLRH